MTQREGHIIEILRDTWCKCTASTFTNDLTLIISKDTVVSSVPLQTQNCNKRKLRASVMRFISLEVN